MDQKNDSAGGGNRVEIAAFTTQPLQQRYKHTALNIPTGSIINKMEWIEYEMNNANRGEQMDSSAAEKQSPKLPQKVDNGEINVIDDTNLRQELSKMTQENESTIRQLQERQELAGNTHDSTSLSSKNNPSPHLREALQEIENEIRSVLHSRQEPGLVGSFKSQHTTSSRMKHTKHAQTDASPFQSPSCRIYFGHDEVEYLRLQSSMQMDELKSQMSQLKKEVRSSSERKQSMEHWSRNLQNRVRELQEDQNKLMDIVLRERKESFIARTESKQLELEIRNGNAERIKVVQDRDTLRAALLNANSQIKTLKAHLERVQTEKDEMLTWQRSRSTENQENMEQLKNHMSQVLQKWKDDEGERVQSMKKEFHTVVQELDNQKIARREVENAATDSKNRAISLCRQVRIAHAKNEFLMDELRHCREQLYGTKELLPNDLKPLFSTGQDQGQDVNLRNESIFSGLPLRDREESLMSNDDMLALKMDLAAKELQFSAVMDIISSLGDAMRRNKENVDCLKELERRIAEVTTTRSPSRKFTVTLESVPDLMQRHNKVLKNIDGCVAEFNDAISSLKSAQETASKTFATNQHRLPFDTMAGQTPNNFHDGEDMYAASVGTDFEKSLTIERLSMELRRTKQRESEVENAFTVAKQVNELMQKQLVTMQEVLNTSVMSETEQMKKEERDNEGSTPIGVNQKMGNNAQLEEEMDHQTKVNNTTSNATQTEENECQKMEDTIQALNDEHQALKNMQMEMANLKKEKENLKADHQELQIEYQTREYELSSLKRQLEETLKDNNSSDTAVRRMTQRLEEKSNELKTAIANNNELNLTIETNRQRIENKAKEFEEEMAALEIAHGEERKKLKEKQLEASNELQQALEECEEKISSIKSLEKRIDLLEEEKKQLEGKLLRYSSTTAQQEQSNQQIVENLQKDLENARRRIDINEQNMKRKEKEVIDTKKRLQRTEQRCGELEKQREVQQSHSQKAEDSFEQLKRSVAIRDNRINALEKERKKMEQALESAEKQWKAVVSRGEVLETEHKNHVELTEQLKRSLAEKDECIKTLEEDRITLSAGLVAAESQSKEMDIRNEELEKQLQSHSLNAEDQLNRMLTERDNHVNALEAERQTLEYALKAVEKQREEEQTRRESLETELRGYKQVVKELEEKLSSNGTELLETQQSLQTDLDNAQLRCLELKGAYEKELARSNELESHLTQALDGRFRDFDDTVASLKKMQTNLNQMAKDDHEVTESFSSSLSYIARMKEELSTLEANDDEDKDEKSRFANRSIVPIVASDARNEENEA